MNKPIIATLSGLALITAITVCNKVHADSYIRLSVGNNSNLTGASIEWDDGGGIGTALVLGHDWEVADKLLLGVNWIHISQLDVGPPWNDEDESSVDHFGVYIEYRW